MASKCWSHRCCRSTGRRDAAGRALLRLRCEDAAACVTALHGQSVGSRWLEARLSNDDEFSAQRRILEEAEAKANDRAPQSFSQPTEEHASIADLPDDPRDIVLLCHEVRESVSNGEYELNNLREGRVDVLARCVSATLFVSHGVRRSSRVWIVLRDAGLTICCDGGTARSLSPDERSLAAAMKRVIGGSPDAGWSVHRDETLEERLRSLTGSKQLVVLHELGEPLEAVLAGSKAAAVKARCLWWAITSAIRRGGGCFWRSSAGSKRA